LLTELLQPVVVVAAAKAHMPYFRVLVPILVLRTDTACTYIGHTSVTHRSHMSRGWYIGLWKLYVELCLQYVF
jgi:hypothetical protein